MVRITPIIASNESLWRGQSLVKCQENEFVFCHSTSKAGKASMGDIIANAIEKSIKNAKNRRHAVTGLFDIFGLPLVLYKNVKGIMNTLTKTASELDPV